MCITITGILFCFLVDINTATLILSYITSQFHIVRMFVFIDLQTVLSKRSVNVTIAYVLNSCHVTSSNHNSGLKVSNTGFSFRLQVEPIHFGLIDRALST
jgi:hypothetical protein